MNEINELLQQIVEMMKKDDIQGYKNMLFLINQVAQSNNEELLNSILKILGELFEKKVIQEQQTMGSNTNSQNCCCKDDDMEKGKSPTIMVGDREWNPYTQGPIDNAVLSQYQILIPRNLRNLVRRNLNRRYSINLDSTEGKYNS
jgi:hypothetical protein